jgi:hypothetical protein
LRTPSEATSADIDVSRFALPSLPIEPPRELVSIALSLVEQRIEEMIVKEKRRA